VVCHSFAVNEDIIKKLEQICVGEEQILCSSMLKSCRGIC
jgi:hypothetical protein